ncbi:Cytochrome P450 82A4 [Bienertia sinuspersici]
MAGSKRRVLMVVCWVRERNLVVVVGFDVWGLSSGGGGGVCGSGVMGVWEGRGGCVGGLWWGGSVALSISSLSFLNFLWWCVGLVVVGSELVRRWVSGFMGLGGSWWVWVGLSLGSGGELVGLSVGGGEGVVDLVLGWVWVWIVVVGLGGSKFGVVVGFHLFLGTHINVEVRGRHFELIPFGAGRRMCPGMSFALQVVHLSLATLLHAFEFSTQDNTSVDFSESFGLANIKVKPLKVLFKPSLGSEAYEP